MRSVSSVIDCNNGSRKPHSTTLPAAKKRELKINNNSSTHHTEPPSARRSTSTVQAQKVKPRLNLERSLFIWLYKLILLLAKQVFATLFEIARRQHWGQNLFNSPTRYWHAGSLLGDVSKLEHISQHYAMKYLRVWNLSNIVLRRLHNLSRRSSSRIFSKQHCEDQGHISL